MARMGFIMPTRSRRKTNGNGVKPVTMRQLANQVIILLSLVILILLTLLALLYKNSRPENGDNFSDSDVKVKTTSTPVYDLGLTPEKKQNETLWVEGEKPTKTAVNRHMWYDKVDKSHFSNNEWLSHYDEHTKGSAVYSIGVKGGEYIFWLRANPFDCRMTYTLGSTEPQEIDFSSCSEKIMLSSEPDIRFIAWTRVGTLVIPKGTHTITFSFESDRGHHAGIDCFVLTTDTSFDPKSKDLTAHSLIPQRRM